MTTRRSDAVEMGGSMTALVTPFHNGQVDWDCWDRLVDRQIAAGTDWLVPIGTTGESPTLSRSERERLIESILSRAAGRRPVMVGTGTNNTSETVDRTRQAAVAGAHAVLVVAPSYNRPTPEGLFRHFTAVAESVEIPIILYNVPARTGVYLDNDTIIHLRKQFPHIVAVKDASGSIDNITELTNRSDIGILCGDDALTWPFMALGARGVISVIGNLVPSLMKSLITAALAMDGHEALRIHKKVHDLATEIGVFGPNPIPIKTAMGIAGLLNPEFRLPLCPLDAERVDQIALILRRHEIVGEALR